MSKFKIRPLLLGLLLAGAVLPQSSSIQYATPEIRRVGDKLACKCGSCNNTVATCQMLQCHYSEPAREKIAGMLAAGSSDQQVVDSFVQKKGLAALAAPPATGFFLLGWIMPFIAVTLGFGFILLWVRRFRGRRLAATSGGDVYIDPRFRERIDKELAELE